MVYTSSIKTKFNIMIYNSIGGLIKDQEQDLKKGKNKINVDLSNLFKGVYILQFSVKDKLASKIYVIQ